VAYNAGLCYSLFIVLFSSKHSRPRYTSLQGSSDALALAQYAAQHSPLVVIAANALEAQRLVEEIPFFDPKLRVHLLPDWETLPYDHFSPHQDLISERLATLHHIRSNASDVVIVPITTALYPLPPVEHLAAYTFFLKRGEKLNVAQLREQMTFAGYNHVQQVLIPGEYCVRGGIIDLFAMGSVLPYRIDLFDDEIETIATFDVDTQRTLYPVPEIRLLPAREFPMDDAGQARFRQNFRDRFEGDPSKSRIYKDVSKGIAPAGIEYYLPLFFDKTATLFDYLPKNATLCLHHNVDEAIASFGKDAASRYNLLRGDPQHPLLETKELFLDGEQFFIRAKEFARLDIVTNNLPTVRPELVEGSEVSPSMLRQAQHERAYLFADDPPLDRIDSVTSLPIPR
jgi:transcription-repair coupling factor (superfamily II helicase)